MKIAVIGSRTFNDYQKLKAFLDTFKHKVSLIVSGGARGADKLSEIWADNNSIPKLILYPDWNLYGKTAGFIRNSKIIQESDTVIAFWDGKSKGTLDSINKAKALNKKIFIIYF